MGVSVTEAMRSSMRGGFSLTVDYDQAGLWMVTSPNYGGVLAAEASLEIALVVAAKQVHLMDGVRRDVEKGKTDER
jgi:hypothetical protein